MSHSAFATAPGAKAEVHHSVHYHEHFYSDAERQEEIPETYESLNAKLKKLDSVTATQQLAEQLRADAMTFLQNEKIAEIEKLSMSICCSVTAIKIAERLSDQEQLVKELKSFTNTQLDTLKTRLGNSFTLLHQFCLVGNTDVVRYMFLLFPELESKVNEKARHNLEEITPLDLVIIEHDNVELLKLLTQHGAEIDHRKMGETAFTTLHRAAQHQREKTVDFLLKHQNAQKIVIRCTGQGKYNGQGVNGFYKYTALHIAIDTGNIGIVKQLVDAKSELLKIKAGNTDWLPWQYAIWSEKINEHEKQDKITCFLLQKEVEKLDFTSSRLLGFVITHCLRQTLQELFKRGLQIKHFNDDALRAAAEQALPQIPVGYTTTTQLGVEILQLLIENDTESRVCPLLVRKVAEQAHYQLLLFLIKRSTGFLPDDDGMYPLHRAADSLIGKRHLLFARLLIKYQQEACEHEALHTRYTPLHLAAKRGNVAIVQALLEFFRQQSRLAQAVNCRDNNDNTPLHMLVNGFDSDVNDAEDRLVIAKLLLRSGVSNELVNIDGEKPIDIAEKKGLEDIYELLENGLAVEAEKPTQSLLDNMDKIEKANIDTANYGLLLMDRAENVTTSNAFESHVLQYEATCFAEIPYYPIDECQFLCNASLENHFLIDRLPTTWWVCVRAIQNDVADYVGIAYWNIKHQQLVIVHRTTINEEDTLINLESTVQGKKLVDIATEFVSKTIKQIRSKIEGQNFSITLVWNSLSGSLAPSIIDRIRGEIGYQPRTIVFNHDGHKLKDNLDPQTLHLMLPQPIQRFLRDYDSSLQSSQELLQKWTNLPEVLNSFTVEKGVISLTENSNYTAEQFISYVMYLCELEPASVGQQLAGTEQTAPPASKRRRRVGEFFQSVSEPDSDNDELYGEIEGHAADLHFGKNGWQLDPFTK